MENAEMNIPKGWKEITLGDVLKYEQPYNYAVTDTAYNAKSGIPVLTAGKSFILGYTDEIDNVYSNFPVIIFDDFTTDSKFVDFPFKVKSSAMKFLKPKNENEHSINFFFEIIQSLRIRGTFADHKRRWISEYSKIKIVAPLFDEQTKIASILSKADAAIEQTEKLIAKYQRIKTGLMQDLLTKGIDEYGNIRNEKTHRFKTENGLRVPEEWEVKELESICKKISDGAHQGVVFDDQKDVPFLFVSCIKPDEILWGNCTWIGFDNYLIVSKGKEPIRGMVLYSVVGSYGNAVTVETDELFTFQRHIAFLIPDEKSLSSEFLTLFLNSDQGKRIADDLATGNAQKTITLTALRTFLIPLPKPNEQKRIFQKVKAASDLVRENQKQLSKLQSLKTGLMQDLLSGKVRVKIKEETLVNQ